MPLIYSPYKMNGKTYLEGSAFDTLAFDPGEVMSRNLIDTVIYFDVLGQRKLIQEPTSIYDAWVHSIINPLTRIAEMDSANYERIHEELHVDTLEGLELVAHDGRLESVPGVGPRRAAAIRASLQAMLSRSRPRRTASAPGGAGEPDVASLLAVDHEYRDKAAAGTLPTIAPRRFNPSGEAWLPVLHTVRDGWHFTALFSNTAQAHQLNRTRDWVVLYFYDDEHAEGQHTVVTETHGPLTGRRVVRGRENDEEEPRP